MKERYERLGLEREHAYKSSEIDQGEVKRTLTVRGFSAGMNQH